MSSGPGAERQIGVAAVAYRNPRDGIRDTWMTAVLASKRIDGETRALLLYLHTVMTPHGRVSIPRAVLAERFGVDPARIKERIRRAAEAGLIVRRSGGYRGRTAEYEALLPDPMRWSPSTPSG